MCPSWTSASTGKCQVCLSICVCKNFPAQDISGCAGVQEHEGADADSLGQLYLNFAVWVLISSIDVFFVGGLLDLGKY